MFLVLFGVMASGFNTVPVNLNILPVKLHKSGLTSVQLFQGFGVGRIIKGILLRFSVEKWQNYTWKIDFAFMPVCLV